MVVEVYFICNCEFMDLVIENKIIFKRERKSVKGWGWEVKFGLNKLYI